MNNVENQRVSIYIDAGNFFHLVLKKLKVRENDFDFEQLIQFLAVGRPVIREGKRFYVGTVREKRDNHETTLAMVHQTALFDRLIAIGGWKILTSKLKTRIERIVIDDRVVDYQRLLSLGINEVEYQRSREKGIDVKIAVDLMAGAIDNRYDTAVIISSDADLIPAIDWVRNKKGKKVEYVGFSISATEQRKETKPTNTLLYNSDFHRILSESDIRKFLKLS
ncbi:MAG: NYN domain-containing protein [bacterium]